MQRESLRVATAVAVFETCLRNVRAVAFGRSPPQIPARTSLSETHFSVDLRFVLYADVPIIPSAKGITLKIIIPRKRVARQRKRDAAPYIESSQSYRRFLSAKRNFEPKPERARRIENLYLSRKLLYRQNLYSFVVAERKILPRNRSITQTRD